MAMSWRNALGLAQPILSSKILDVGEFLLIIRDDGVTEGKCLSRNEQSLAPIGLPACSSRVRSNP
jgi:hypothetical protein